MSTSAKVSVQLSLEASNFIRDAQKAGQVGEDAMKRIDRAAKSSDQAIQDVGSTAGKVAAGGVAVLFATGKAAMDWESQWASVTKTVDGTAGELERIEGDLREMARTMPATHAEIAAVAAAAGALGVATPDVADFTRTMIMLGEATDDLTADQAATAIAQIRNVLQMAPQDVDNFSAALVELGNNGASSEAGILALAQRVAGAGASLGIAEQDVLALSAAMANLGIEAELGGGAVQRVMLEMNTAVSSGTDAVADYAKVAGMSAEEFASAWESRPVEAFDLFIQGLGRIQDSGGDVASVLKDMGIEGTQNLQVMLRLAGAGDGLTQALEMSGRAWSDNTALIDEYAARAATTDSQVTVAWNNIRDAGIEAGETLLPIIAQVAGAVGGLASAFGELPDPVQSSVTTAVAVLAGGGGLVWATTKVAGAVVSAKDSLDALSGSSTKAAGAVGKVGRAATIATIALAGFAVADALTSDFDEGAISAEKMTRALLDLRTVKDVPSDLSDLGDQIERLADPNWAQGLQTNIADVIGFGDSDELYEARDTIESLDAALSSMVQGGNPEAAADALERVKEGLTGDQASALVDLLPGYADALLAAQNSAELAADGTDEFAGAMDGATNSAYDEAEAIMRAVNAMQAKRDAAIRAADAEVNWYAAIDEANASLKQNGRTLDLTTEAGRANRRALTNLAGAWNGLSDEQKNAQGAAKSARAEFVRVATQMGMTREEARKYAKQLMEIPPKRATRIDLDTSAALSGIAAFETKLQALTQPRTVSVRFTSSGAPILPSQARADGGEVLGQRYPYGDKVLIWAAPGEEVITNRNGEADRFRADRAAGRIPAYAAGGTIGASSPSARHGAGGDEPARRTARSLERMRTELEKSTDALKDERDQRKSLIEAVAGQFNTSLWDSNASVWSSSAQDPFGILAGDIADLRAFDKARATLESKGLDGPALENVLAEGGLAGAQTLAALSRKELARYERMYEQRATLQQRVGRAAGDAAYGEAIRDQVKELKALGVRLDRLESATKRVGKDVGETINKTASTAARNRRRDNR